MTKDEIIEMINASSCSPSEKWKLATAVDKLAEVGNSAKPIVSRRLSADDMTELIDRHIARMWGGLEMESVKYWIETGKIGGNFRLRLLAMLQFADWKLERLEKANGA